MSENQRVVLASRPSGWVTEANFRVEDVQVPKPRPGEVLVKNVWLSLDPYMRGRMNAGKSYAAPVQIGEVMTAATVGEVLESRHPGFRAGEHVTGSLGWQLYATAEGAALTKVDGSAVPLSAYLGVCGMPGATAYIGLLHHCAPRAGETVLVSAATGAVGSVVGQIARLQGCRAVGIAGGERKVAYACDELGFDACADHKGEDLLAQLTAACPDGVDCLFENVGGEVMETSVRLLNPFSRIALCGLVAEYNATQAHGFQMMRALLVNRVKLQGFIVFDRPDWYRQAVQQLVKWVAAGKVHYHETVSEGLDSAPRAFIGMLRGENLGKQLVRLA